MLLILLLILITLCLSLKTKLHNKHLNNHINSRLKLRTIDTIDEKWVDELGKDNAIIRNKVKVATINGLRGIIANEPTSENDALVVVTANVALEVTNNRPPSPFPDLCPQSLWEESLWDQRLAFKLLHELSQGSQSTKKAWLEQLPKSFSTPLHWNPSTLKLAQYPSLESKVTGQKEEWLLFYNKWKESLPTESKKYNSITFNEFTYALEVINSRAFSGPYEGSDAGQRQGLFLFTGILTLVWPLLGFGTTEQALSAAIAVGLSILIRDVFFSRVSGLKRYVVCPYVDFFNHKSSAKSEVSYNYFSNQFELRTQATNVGEQVYISYGKQSNDRLLQYYGFVEEECPYDIYDYGVNILELLLKYADDLAAKVPIPLSPSPQERLQKIALALAATQVDDVNSKSGRVISKRASTGDALTVRYFRAPLMVEGNTVASNTKYDDISVRCLRALYSTTDEWNSLKLDSLERLGVTLSSETENKVEKACATIAQLELESKPTSIQDDLITLKELNNNDNSKGFSSNKITNNIKNNDDDIDPSGVFKDSKIAALSFCIEKKKLLLEASKS